VISGGTSQFGSTTFIENMHVRSGFPRMSV
jgi:hypothetical protein